MRTKAIPAEYYQQFPVIKFGILHTGFTQEAELPMNCVHPHLLVTQKGNIAEFLISYKPIEQTEDNVEITRHSFYVTEETWRQVKKAVDDWKANGAN